MQQKRIPFLVRLHPETFRARMEEVHDSIMQKLRAEAEDSARRMGDKIEMAVVKDKPTLVVIDYLQLVRSTRHFQDKTGEINECLLKLRELTTTRNIATLLVTNIAKGCDENTEIGNIGKGSNQIDFDVDNLLFGHRAGEVGPDGEIKIQLKAKKIRQGEMSDVQLWFFGKYQEFEDASEVPEFAEFSTPSWGTV